jgi:[acyl-carrier-protein] S-malonyltransferase
VNAAWVDGLPVPAAEVTAELTRLRSGPGAGRLPRDGTADGRQLRRWVTQRVVVRRLLERECAARGLDGAPPMRPDPALLGTAAADVLAVSAAARAVFAAATAAVVVPEADVRAAYDRDRPARPERWTVRQAFSRDTPPTALPATATDVDPRTLLPEVRAAAGPAPALVRTELGWHLVAVDAVLPAGPVPYADVRAQLAATLTDRARQTAFARWLDTAIATRTRLAPGYEHPADPANPDATHRH